MMFPCYPKNIHKTAVKKKITSGEVEKKGPIFVPQHFFSPAAENVARPKSRVARNGYFDPYVAPAHQRS